jgi:hypothetical protein
MNIFRKTVLSAAVAATAFATVSADAGERWRDHRHYRSESNKDGDLVAAGIVGLALGALVVGALASSRDEPVAGNPLRHPRPSPNRDFMIEGSAAAFANGDQAYDEPSFEPWSRSWYRYCRDRYRTFDATTGTYVGRDGRKHFCNPG